MPGDDQCLFHALLHALEAQVRDPRATEYTALTLWKRFDAQVDQVKGVQEQLKAMATAKAYDRPSMFDWRTHGRSGTYLFRGFFYSTGFLREIRFLFLLLSFIMCVQKREPLGFIVSQPYVVSVPVTVSIISCTSCCRAAAAPWWPCLAARSSSSAAR